MPNIILQSADGENFKVDVEIAKCSRLLKNMLEDLGVDEKEEEIVPLPNVNAAILKKVIEWVTYHKDVPPQSTYFFDVPEWDAEFLKVDQKTLCELVLAANYLNIENLFDLTCTTVANMLTGKTAIEIRQEFNIENDFIALEEKQL